MPVSGVVYDDICQPLTLLSLNFEFRTTGFDGDGLPRAQSPPPLAGGGVGLVCSRGKESGGEFKDTDAKGKGAFSSLLQMGQVCIP